jgi:hypothetical protein
MDCATTGDTQPRGISIEFAEYAMKRWRGLAPGVGFLAMAVLPGQSCGPFFTEAIFVLHQPESREELMKGNPGIIWPDFGFVDLALAYRAMQGPVFTAAEIEGERVRQVATDGVNENARQHSTMSGMDLWVKARGEGGKPIAVDANVPGQQWQSYGNCLDDAFATAAKTLQSRQRENAADKAALAAWVVGQDQVFSNCGGLGDMPSEIGASSPEWLRQDRAYQSAAAHFYRAEWQPAQADFTAIAADKSSSWHDLASYMIARAMIRQATLSKPDAIDEALLRQAGTQLRKVTSRGGPYAQPAQALLNYVDLRVAPGTAAARQGDSIAKPDTHLQQDLIDLRYALSSPRLQDQLADARRSDLVDWVLTATDNIGREDPAAHAVERWRATKSPAWLASAIMLAGAPQPDLIAATAAVPQSSPAWATVTYYRLRLTRNEPGFEAEVTRLLPEVKTLSTRNAFQEMAQMRAESLEEFIKLAAMEPAAYDDGAGDLTLAYQAVAPTPTGAKMPTMAGLPVNLPDAKRFNPQSAAVINERLPLETLAAIVQQRAFAKQLQFELAMAVWSRAVLLDKPEVAHSLTVAMVEGEPGWKPWLLAYDGAKTADDRQVAALLALMRFPSVRPYVNAGPAREDGFVGYSAYRDNWWCAEMGNDPRAGSNYSASYNYSSPYQNQPGSPASSQVKQDTLPPFLTAVMLSQAKEENRELREIGDAPAYFGQQALAWVKAHPSDPRNAELLGFAFRAMRNGCNLEKSYSLRREVFGTLHARYGQSEWAKKYPNFTDLD